MAKLDCWEFKKCGRHLGGLKVSEFGVCPAANAKHVNGINGGRSSGRCCYAVAGTFCGRKVQGTFAEKSLSCMSCDFYKVIHKEEGRNLVPVTAIVPMLQKASV
jgi:hypothetical protein